MTPRPTTSDVVLTVAVLLLSGVVLLATAPVPAPAAVLAVVQALSILLVRARPATGVAVAAVTMTAQFALGVPTPPVVWPVLAYLMLRNRTPRAGLLLACAVTAGCLGSGLALATLVDPERDLESGFGFGIGLLAATGALVALAAALGWTVRTAREQAVNRRETRAVELRVAAVAAERARIADELNGLVVQALHRLVARTDGLRDRLSEPPPVPSEALAAVQADARGALTAMRRGLVLLRSEAPPPPPPAEPARSGRVPRPTPSGLALTVAFGALTLLVNALSAGTAVIPGLERVVPLLQIQGGWLTLLLPALQLAALGWWRSAPLTAFAVGTLGSLGSTLTGSTQYVAEISWWALAYGAAAGAPALVSALTVLVGTLALLGVGLAFPSFDYDTTLFVGGFLLVAPLWAIGALRRRSTLRAEREAASRAAERTLAAVHDERHRIARELHDVIAHHVSAIAVQAGAARTPGVGPEVVAAAVDNIEDYGRRTRDALPELVDLVPPSQPVTLSESGVRELVRTAGLPVSVQVSGTSADHGDAELFAHRILVEALTNVLRHAGPTPTAVTVEHADDAVTVSIVDRGPVPGHRAAVRGSGLGLVGMRERAALLGGEVRAGPDAGSGWSVRARLPRRLLLQEEAGPAGSSRAPTRQPDPAT